jgi:hypothetical protein
MDLPEEERLELLVALARRSWSAEETAAAAADDAVTNHGKGYEHSFQEFAAVDRALPPEKGGILFVGSSIFSHWKTVGEQMAPLPVLNRAFGGSRTADQLALFDQLITVYAPKIVVYYCGSNDLKAGIAPEDPPSIFARFRAFAEKVQATQPGTSLVYVSATRSPDRVARWEQVDHYNALVRAYCTATPHHTFIDSNPALVDTEGHPRLELYVADKLHFKPAAYVVFTALIKPVLTRLWAEGTVKAAE